MACLMIAVPVVPAAANRLTLSNTIEGLIVATEIELPAGQTAFFRTAELHASTVVIAGVLYGLESASLTIHADLVEISGVVRAGNGVAASPAAGISPVAGEGGGHGGSISIFADRLRVSSEGLLSTGHGGAGGDATATGLSEGEYVVGATGGNGGRGGLLRLEVRELTLMGPVSLGNGGPGGSALAEAPEGVAAPDVGLSAFAQGGDGGDSGEILGTKIPSPETVLNATGGPGGDATARAADTVEALAQDAYQALFGPPIGTMSTCGTQGSASVVSSSNGASNTQTNGWGQDGFPADAYAGNAENACATTSPGQNGNVGPNGGYATAFAGNGGAGWNDGGRGGHGTATGGSGGMGADGATGATGSSGECTWYWDTAGGTGGNGGRGGDGGNGGATIAYGGTGGNSLYRYGGRGGDGNSQATGGHYGGNGGEGGRGGTGDPSGNGGNGGNAGNGGHGGSAFRKVGVGGSGPLGSLGSGGGTASAGGRGLTQSGGSGGGPGLGCEDPYQTWGSWGSAGSSASNGEYGWVWGNIDLHAEAGQFGGPLFELVVRTTDATFSSGEPSPCCSIGKTIWYKFVSPKTNNVCAGTYGSSYDTVLAIWVGGGGGSYGTLATYNDDSGGTLQSWLTWPATAGQTYYVQLGGYGGASGQAKLGLNWC